MRVGRENCDKMGAKGKHVAKACSIVRSLALDADSMEPGLSEGPARKQSVRGCGSVPSDLEDSVSDPSLVE